MEKIAYLGLGKMGTAMAANLLKKGFQVTLWNRSKERYSQFSETRANVAATPADAIIDAQVIMYSLADDEAINAVVFGPRGILTKVEKGQIAVNLSTVHPSMSLREFKAYNEKGVEFLDAPVFGSVPEAEAGDLWIVVGGKREVYEKIKPVLEALSESTHYMGETGKGASMGLIGSLVVGMQIQALGEGLVLAQKAGLKPKDVIRVLNLPDFRSPIFERMGEDIINRDFKPVFSLKHMHKDINQIAQLAQELMVPVPATAVVRETINTAVNLSLGEENASALIKTLEMEADVVVGEVDKIKGGRDEYKKTRI